MKQPEQSVKPSINKAVAQSQKQQSPERLKEAEKRATELPGDAASVAAELKNRKK